MTNDSVKLSLDDISFDTYSLLFSSLSKEGFNPPAGAKKWKSVKLSISKEKSNVYRTIELDGIFPGGQIELNNRVSEILKELEPCKIKCCFKIDEIDKNRICQELKDRGFITEEYNNNKKGEFCIIIFCSDCTVHSDDILLPSWLLYAIRDASEGDNKDINVQIYYDDHL